MNKTLTYYELLKVSSRASVAEIVSAYHTARNAFAPDSLAVYTLYSAEEASSQLKQLEEAYFVLSNLERRREYDLKLARGESAPPAPAAEFPSIAELARQAARPPIPDPAPSRAATEISHAVPATAAPELFHPVPATAAPPIAPPAPFAALPETPAPPPAPPLPPDGVSGWILAQARERQGLMIEDVARLTKIPARAITAIENEDLVHLPARVYLQGFLRNLARIYRLPADTTITTYLARIDLMKNKPAA